jgi:hypothetical protein
MSPLGRHGPGGDATERQRSGIGLIPYLLAPTEGPEGRFQSSFRRFSPMTTAESPCAGTDDEVSSVFRGYEGRAIFWRITLVA